MVAFYQTDNTSSSRLYFTASNWNLSGGSSDNVSFGEILYNLSSVAK